MPHVHWNLFYESCQGVVGSIQMRYLLGSNLLVADRNSSRECGSMFGTSYKMWLWLCSWSWTPEASHPIANCGVHSCANSTAFLYAINARFFFYRHRDRLYLQGSHRECYTYTYVIPMAIQVAMGISRLRGLLCKHWKARAIRHYILLKLQNIFLTVVSS